MWLLAPRPSTRSELQGRLEAGNCNQDVVVLTITLGKIDYAELKEIADLRAAVESVLSKSVATFTGKASVVPEHVALAPSVESKDTAKIQGVVTPPTGVTASELLSDLKKNLSSKKPSLNETIAKGLQAIPGIEKVAKEQVQVSDVSSPSVTAIIYPDLKLERKHGIPNGVFSLMESLHALDDCRMFNKANTDELTTAEIVWAFKKCAEVFKDARLEKLFVWMITSLWKKDRRSCNEYACTVAPNTLQFILAENPAKEEICGGASAWPRDRLIGYCADSLACVAIAIAAGDVLQHWTYDFGAVDQSFLGEAAEKLSNWPEASVPMAQALWDRTSCRYILIEHAAIHSSAEVASGYLQRCPKDILCSHFKAPWKGGDANASFFHLYPSFAKKEKDSAEHLIDCLAQADVYSASDLSGALKVFMEDPEVTVTNKRELILSFVSACRRWENTPAPASSAEGPSPRKCSIFKRQPAKEEEVGTSPRSTKDLELIALDFIVKDYKSLKTLALKGTPDESAQNELAEMLEAVLLLSSGDSLTVWAKKLVEEDALAAADAKHFLKTVAMTYVSGLLVKEAGGDKKVKYDDNRARELIEGTKLWQTEGPFGSPKNKGRKAEDLGQVLRMYVKFDLALDGGSILNFLRAMDEGQDLMGSVFTKIAPKGSRLRLAIAEDVRRSMGPGALKEDEIDPLLSCAGFFDPSFQSFIRSEEAMEDTRSWFEADGEGSKPKGMGIVPLLEATAKLVSVGGCAELAPEDAVLDVCEQCVSNPVTWKLFGKIVDGVRKSKWMHDSDECNLGVFADCAKEMSKTGRLLHYKLNSGVSKSLQTDIEKVIDSFIEKSPPKSWVGSIKSLDTVMFLLEYMGKEDLGLAFERFEHEMKHSGHGDLADLVQVCKKIYSQPLATSSDVDIGAAIQKKASLMKGPLTWRGCTFEPADWKHVLEIVGAAAESMKQRYSVIMLPHHTQLISLLMFGIRACGTRVVPAAGEKDLPKTMLARVGTGEGKSLIIGMLAAFVAKKGLRAHVVNNNRVLTQRDYRGNAAIFDQLGLQASANPQDIKNKDCLVCYCTGDDVESACLDSLMDGASDEYDRLLEDSVLIVDEVDGLIFDRGTTSSKWFGDREFSDWVNEWLSQLMMHGKIQRDWDDFRSVDEWTLALQKEVEEAFHESETKQEEVDYTKRGDRLYLIDPKTKMVKEQDWSLWLEILKSQRNHPAQWIEYKYEKAILSSLQCFMSYACIFGLTGSLGGSAESSYLGEHYEATAFMVPPFLDTCRTEGGKIQGKKIPQEIIKTDPFSTMDAQNGAVIELALQKCQEVPVLVILQTSDGVKSLSKVLQDKLVEMYGPPDVGEDEGEEATKNTTVIELLHNPRNPKEFVELVERATEPLCGPGEAGEGPPKQIWRITLTTAEGGRGHDYRVVDPSIDEKGGLLLILCFVPWSEREWIQFIGRTGRQDHSGQYAVFLEESDEQVKAAQPDKGPQETLVEAILRHGDEACAKMLEATQHEIVKGRIMHTFTMRYWALHKQDKTTAKQNWEWKKLCKEYVGMTGQDIQDRFYGIFPHEPRFEVSKKKRKQEKPQKKGAPAEVEEVKPEIKSLSSKKEDLLQSTDGQRYKGDLVGGKPHGYGVFKTADGARYEGQWEQGQRSGKGKYVDASGATYEGQWKEHDKSGKGVESYPDKARYEGDFLKGCKHGVGKYTTSTGATYEGQFVKDKYDGEGTYDFTSGRKYIGQWKRGQMEGHGKMVWANGVSYEGSYEQDVRHGEGIVKWPDGRVYQGHWHKGRLVGSGVMLEKDGGQKLML